MMDDEPACRQAGDERPETPAHCVSIRAFPFGIRHSAFGIPGIDCLSYSCAIA